VTATLPQPGELRDWAARYVTRGWRVFLLATDSIGGKVPFRNCESCRPDPPAVPHHDPATCGHLLCHGFHAATTDPDRLDQMLRARPAGKLAIRTGHASGLVVLDVEHDHLDVIDRWEELTSCAALPVTATARSVSGGRHLYYRLPPGAPAVTSGRFADGADVKAEAGYVGAVGGQDGREWLGVAPGEVPALAELPADALAWLTSRRRRGFGGGAGGGPGEDYDFAAFQRDGCPDGHRDYFINDLCFRLRRRGVDRERYDEAVFRAWTRVAQPPEARYEMPWEHAAYKADRVWREVEPNPLELPAWARAAGPGGDGTGAGESANGHRPIGGVAVTGWEHGEPLSDTGNGLRFVRLLGDRARYVTETRRWLLWDGTRWAPDDLNRVTEWTKAVINDLRAEVLAVDEDQRNRHVAWVRATESVRGRRAVLEAAAAEDPVAVRVADLDRDPWLLVVRNGTLDLRDGTLRASGREDLCTRRANVSYDPGADCPRWREHVRFVTRGDAALAAYLRRAVGYTLTGSTLEQAFFLLEGPGANGKNAFIEPLLELLGDYAQTGTSALLTGGDEQHPTILADLAGARLVFVDEARQGRPLNVERVKQLTGSRRVKARRMNRDFFEFDAQLKLWIAGNNHPAVRDSSDATWRRLHRVNFTAVVDGQRRIADYGRLLYEEEAAGILNWALEGLRDWQRIGSLGAPDTVLAATRELRDEEDLVGTFLAERCVITGADGDTVTTDQLYGAYVMWCALAGVRAADRLERRHFGRDVVAHGLGRYLRREGGALRRGYTGLKLVTEVHGWTHGEPLH